MQDKFRVQAETRIRSAKIHQPQKCLKRKMVLISNSFHELVKHLMNFISQVPICNFTLYYHILSLDPSLVDIVRFGLFPFGSPLKTLERVCSGKVSTPLCSPPQPMWDITIHHPLLTFFLFSNRCGIPAKSTPLWGLASLLAHRLVSTPFGEQTSR